ncbi:MAG: sensor histidine kinase [Acidimicrobiia bacterium]
MNRILELRSWPQGFWLDMSIAAVYTAIALGQLAWSPIFDGVVEPALVLFVLMQTAFLGFRRRYPFTVHLIASVGLALQANAFPRGVSTDATLISIYSVAAYGTWRLAWLALGLTLADVVWVLSQTPGWDEWQLIQTFVLWAGVWGLGVFTRLQHDQIERRTRRVTQLEQERKLARQNAIAEERGRMARELHDSVGHSVTGIVMLAGAVRGVEKQSEVVQDAVVAIERSGLEAMAELDSLIGLLRDEDQQGGSARQPGLRDLDGLFTRAEAMGLEVDRDIADVGALVPAIDRAAFRIVQETLTNAAKYANPGRVSVAIRAVNSSIEIEVVNAVLVDATQTNLSSGRGLIGMDERVSILGGSFEAGPTPDGEFRVLARLPTAAHPVA